MDVHIYHSWRKLTSVQEPQWFISFTLYCFFQQLKKKIKPSIPEDGETTAFPQMNLFDLVTERRFLRCWNGRSIPILDLLVVSRFGLIRYLFQ